MTSNIGENPVDAVIYDNAINFTRTTRHTSMVLQLVNETKYRTAHFIGQILRNQGIHLHSIKVC